MTNAKMSVAPPCAVHVHLGNVCRTPVRLVLWCHRHRAAHSTTFACAYRTFKERTSDVKMVNFVRLLVVLLVVSSDLTMTGQRGRAKRPIAVGLTPPETVAVKQVRLLDAGTNRQDRVNNRAAG